MAAIKNVILGVLILQTYINAAPSQQEEVSKLEDIQADPTLESVSEEATGNSATQTTRQKRWYDIHGYGFPPISPVIYPSYDTRDTSDETALYGIEDPFTLIYRRLQEIASIVKKPAPRPVEIPIFYPVLYIPGAGCGCNGKPSTSTKAPVTEGSTTEMPTVTERQNIPPTDDQEDDDEDEYVRPISFTPIQPSRPIQRPAPPVEHGSVQGEVGDQPTTSLNDVIPIAQNPTVNEEAPVVPSACDSAIISCCHQPQLDYSCFAAQGCSDFTTYSGGKGRPCDSNIILRAVNRFQSFYSQKLG